MKKSDLENGMIVEYENGQRAIVIKDFYDKTLNAYKCNNLFINLSLCGFVTFKHYNEDLTLIVDMGNGYNIKKVGYPKSIGCDFKGEKNIVWLWERKEIKLTDDERKLLEVLYNQGLRWMARDWNASIIFFEEKPTEEEGHWDTRFEYFGTISNMFAFMTEEDDELYSIEELLKGE